MISDELEERNEIKYLKTVRILANLPRVHYLPRIMAPYLGNYLRAWFENSGNAHIRVHDYLGSIDYINRWENYQFTIGKYTYQLGDTNRNDFNYFLNILYDKVGDIYLREAIKDLTEEIIPFPRRYVHGKRYTCNVIYEQVFIYAIIDKDDFTLGKFRCKFDE